MRDLIRRYALENAVKYGGKTNPGAVIGKVFAEFPDKKNPEVIKEIHAVCSEVNKLSVDDQKKQLEVYGPQELKKKSQEFSLPELQNVSGPVILRFAPNPSGHLHIGHARQAVINWIYHERYGGEYILREDDTDPKNKVPLKEVYNEAIKDLAWLGIKPTEVVIQSKRLPIYYKYAKQFVDQGKAYVCRCGVGEKRNSLSQKLSCKCREESVSIQKKEWKKFFSEYKEGEAVLRIKTDLQHKNPAVRDWPAFRIVDNPQHPLVKNKHVWPLLNFASAIDDIEFQITHIIRGIDLQVSDERQKYIFEALGKQYPVTIYTGKMNFQGTKSKSEAKQKIESGEFVGWDDIRLGTFRALRRRGILPETVVHFMKEAGLSKSEMTISMEKLAAFNRQLLDRSANRYFFVANPKQVTIQNAPKLKVVVPLHPDVPERGSKIFHTAGKFLLADELQRGKIYRLMHAFNIRDHVFLSKDLDLSLHAQLIHWLPDNDKNIPVEVLMPDGSIVSGLGEPSLKKLKIGTHVQFYRFGFVILDVKENEKLVFWMSHE